MELSASTKLLAVIGDPIHHSMSPTMHNVAIEQLDIDYVYVAFHVKPNSLDKACEGFRALEITGVNVTIPHKINIMKYLDEIDPLARGIGAINTIKNENGKLIAKNTDGIGALNSLKDAGFNPQGRKVIILGCGGAAKAISFTLAQSMEEVVLVNRTYEKAINLKKNLDEFFSDSQNRADLGMDDPPRIKSLKWDTRSVNTEMEDAELFINTTSVGMSPDSDTSPLDTLAISLHPDLFVFDCVYNPLKTKLLRKAESEGCKTLEGIDMLVKQGVEAFKWWTGYQPNADLMKKAAIKKLGL